MIGETTALGLSALMPSPTSSRGSAFRAPTAFDRWIAGEQLVYNFEVEGSHTYFVGETGAWVHNACAPGASAGARDATFDPNRAGHIFRNASGHVNPTSAGSRARYADLFR